MPKKLSPFEQGISDLIDQAAVTKNSEICFNIIEKIIARPETAADRLRKFLYQKIEQAKQSALEEGACQSAFGFNKWQFDHSEANTPKQIKYNTYTDKIIDVALKQGDHQSAYDCTDWKFHSFKQAVQPEECVKNIRAIVNLAIENKDHKLAYKAQEYDWYSHQIYSDEEREQNIDILKHMAFEEGDYQAADNYNKDPWAGSENERFNPKRIAKENFELAICKLALDKGDYSFAYQNAEFRRYELDTYIPDRGDPQEGHDHWHTLRPECESVMWGAAHLAMEKGDYKTAWNDMGEMLWGPQLKKIREWAFDNRDLETAFEANRGLFNYQDMKKNGECLSFADKLKEIALFQGDYRTAFEHNEWQEKYLLDNSKRKKKCMIWYDKIASHAAAAEDKELLFKMLGKQLTYFKDRPHCQMEYEQTFICRENLADGRMSSTPNWVEEIKNNFIMPVAAESNAPEAVLSVA